MSYSWRRRVARRCCAEVLLFAVLGGAAFGVCRVETVASLASDPGTPNSRGQISYSAASSWGTRVSQEGMAERVSDVLIHDDGTAPRCFQTGNTITLRYAAPIASGAGVDVFDSSGAGLTISQSAGGATVTLTVLNAGTAGNLTTSATGSAVRVRNVRVDASTLLSGVSITVTVQATAAGTLASVVKNAGLSYRTIASRAITSGNGAQNAGGTLAKHAVFTFSEGFPGALRAAATNASGVYGDIASSGTSLVLDAGNSVPLGVTVTFPASIVTGGFTFSLRGGTGTCNGPSPCYAIYDTTGNSGSGLGISLTTAAAARSGAEGSTPAIGVQIGPASATGTVTLRALFGPGVSGSGNDDMSATAVPRYAGAREILSGTWFTVAPTTVMASVSSTSITFPNTAVGSSSQDTVILTNVGMLALQIGSIAINSGEFSQTNNCGSTLAGGASCVITVRFVPLVSGPRGASLTIASNATGSPFSIQLSGTGEIVNPVPTVTALVPGGAAAGLTYLRLVVKGTNFVPGATVLWNGHSRGSTVVSSTEIDAGLLADDLATPGTAQVAVQNPAPGGGISNALNFTVGAGPVPAAAYLYYLPHVVTGNGFCTKITVVDLSGKPNNVTLNFVAQDGTLLESESHALAAGGTLRVETDDAEQFTASKTKWAIVGTQGKALAHVMFEIRESASVPQVTNTVGFGDSVPMTEFTMPVEFAPRPEGVLAGRTVGLALANPNGTGVTVTLQLMNDTGAIVVTYPVSLPPFGQTAVDLSNVPEFQRALPAGTFVGSLAATASAPVAVIALEDNYGPFAALAPVQGRAR